MYKRQPLAFAALAANYIIYRVHYTALRSVTAVQWTLPLCNTYIIYRVHYTAVKSAKAIQ